MKFTLTNIISLLIGLISTLFIVSFLDFNKTDPGPKIIVALNPVGPGEVIHNKNIKFVEWPKGHVPMGSFQDIKSLHGRVVKDKIYPNEPILEIDLAPVGSKAGLESLIEVGKRAITVRVNDVIGVAGFALPGSYVDIIANIKRNKSSVSKVVLSHVKVLAVAQATNVAANKPIVVKAVTLELTPLEAEKLDLTRSIGTLSLALRNKLDSNVEVSNGVSMQDLIAIKNNIKTTQIVSKKPSVKPIQKKQIKKPNLDVTEIRALEIQVTKAKGS